MKKFIISLLFFGILALVIYTYQEEIHNFLQDIFDQREPSVLHSNQYQKTDHFSFVSLTDDFTPNNYQDLLNIYYTFLNSGDTDFTFYCDREYERCLTDVQMISNDQTTLSSINNFVHPFNSFKNMETVYTNRGEVTLSMTPTYDEDTIQQIEEKVKRIEDEIWSDTNTTEQKIRKAHDYIINHSTYDKERSDYNIIKYHSDTAYGPLFEGYSLCGGYADVMAIFLSDLELVNYKVSSNNHVWNAVNLNGKWYHLDLTWDDPIMSDGSSFLDTKFYLITTETLQEIEQEEHYFDKNIYQELK